MERCTASTVPPPTKVVCHCRPSIVAVSLVAISSGPSPPPCASTDDVAPVPVRAAPPSRRGRRGMRKDMTGRCYAGNCGGNTMIERKQRIPMRDLSTMEAEDREAIEKNAMGGRIFNIFKVLAHHPKLVKRWTPFAGHILGKQTLPFRDRELLILRIGWLNQAEYEFAQHELIARRGGLSDEDIGRIKQGPTAAGWSEKEAALMQAADDLYENSVVSDATWATLSASYSTEQLDDFLPGAKK